MGKAVFLSEVSFYRFTFILSQYPLIYNDFRNLGVGMLPIITIV